MEVKHEFKGPGALREAKVKIHRETSLFKGAEQCSTESMILFNSPPSRLGFSQKGQRSSLCTGDFT